MLGTVLLCFSFVFACFAAGYPTGVLWDRWHVGWLAFAFFIASLLFGSVSHLLR